MTKDVFIGVAFLFLFCAGCSKKKNDKIVPKQPPGKATLTFPAQNAACTNGAIGANNQIQITFTWNSSANTDSYEVVITNLIDKDIIKETSSENQLTVPLDFNTPFSWYVVSESNGVTATAQSDIWKFYLSGPGSVSHPPFPADHLNPSFGQVIAFASGGISLEWNGSSPDNDIVGYDIYLDTLKTPTLLKTGVTNNYLNNVRVLSAHTYYWKVITKDSAGNSSDSGLFQFSVN